jgi:hypothetical protein
MFSKLGGDRAAELYGFGFSLAGGFESLIQKFPLPDLALCFASMALAEGLKQQAEESKQQAEVSKY